MNWTLYGRNGAWLILGNTQPSPRRIYKRYKPYDTSQRVVHVLKPRLLAHEPLSSHTSTAKFIDAILLNILQHSSLAYGSCNSL